MIEQLPWVVVFVFGVWTGVILLAVVLALFHMAEDAVSDPYERDI